MFFAISCFLVVFVSMSQLPGDFGRRFHPPNGSSNPLKTVIHVAAFPAFTPEKRKGELYIREGYNTPLEHTPGHHPSQL